jgi:hypothetical protein
MTNVAVWYVSKTDEVWGVGDARVRSRHAQLTDQAAKILPLTLRLLNPADAGPGWKEGTQATIGFAYAGNTMSALLTHAALSVFLAHIGGNGASLPPMRKVSDLCAHVSQRYVKDIGVAAARPAAEYVIYGRCPASGEFAAFHVQAGRDGGMFEHKVVEVDIVNGEAAILGDSQDALRRRIVELCALKSLCFGGVEPRIAIEERIRTADHESVGGTLQFGIDDREGFQIKASVFNEELGRGAMQYLGFGLRAEIEAKIGSPIALEARL